MDTRGGALQASGPVLSSCSTPTAACGGQRGLAPHPLAAACLPWRRPWAGAQSDSCPRGGSPAHRGQGGTHDEAVQSAREGDGAQTHFQARCAAGYTWSHLFGVVEAAGRFAAELARRGVGAPAPSLLLRVLWVLWVLWVIGGRACVCWLRRPVQPQHGLHARREHGAVGHLLR